MAASVGNNMGTRNAADGRRWSSEHDAALRQHIGANLSFTDAARRINAEFGTSYSRNATIGRAGRIGLKSNVPKSEGSMRQTRYHGGEWRRAAPKPKPTPPPVIFKCEPATGLHIADVVPRLIPLAELEPGDCRWPYGHGPFHFCGHPASEGPYCFPHFRLAIRQEKAA